MSLKHRIAITPTLTTVIGCFVFVTAALILFVQTSASNRAVRTLGGELVRVGIESLEQSFADQVDAVEDASQYTVNALETGSIRLDRPQEVAEYLFGVLAPMDHVSFAIIVDRSGSFIEIDRGKGDGVLVPQFVPNTDETHHLDDLIDATLQRRDPHWTEPVYLPERRHTYIARITPVRTGDRTEALVVLAMSLERLSEVTKDISTDVVTVFLLRPGTSDVIAHPDLPSAFDRLNPANPLVDLPQLPDQVLTTLEQTVRVDPTQYRITDDHDLRVGEDQGGNKRFILIDTRPEGFSGFPAAVGAHFSADVLEQPLHQVTQAATIGAGLLGLSLIGAGLLAHRIGQPIRRAASNARSVAGLDFDAAAPLPGSFVRELDDLSTGFNAMVSGLKAFGRYVPKTLVSKLISEGRTEAPPEEREVAVLFTDIAGYTSLSEGLTATETAEFINHHLSLVGAQITSQGGTIDKYIGDAVMAFWGAPDNLDNPAEPAARAALGIAAAVRHDNQSRKRQGLTPVRLRIGVHLGPLVVGDIGAPERVNYTVIGDTVNIAARLESLGKDVDPDAEVVILVSGEVARRLGTDLSCEAIGPRKIKGRDEPVDVVRLASRTAEIPA